MRPRIELDYYAILGVRADADGMAIQKAYRSRAKRCHPDVFPIGSGDRQRAEAQFKVLNEAREVLMDSQLRAVYDSLRPRKELEEYVPPYPMDIPRPVAAPGPYAPPYGRRTSHTSRFDVNLTFGDALKQAEEGVAGPPDPFPDEADEPVTGSRRQERADFYYDRGLKYARYGRTQLALDCFRQAAYLDPGRKIPLWLHLYQRRQIDRGEW